MTTLANAKLLQNSASILAARLATSAQLTTAIAAAIQIAKDNKITVANIHFELFGDPYSGTEGLLSDDDMAKLPVVGSEEGKTGNLPFDKYEYKNAEGTTVKTSFWREVAEHHPVGADLQHRIEMIRNAEKVRNDWTDVPSADRERYKKDLKADFDAFFSKLKLAVQCYHMMVDVSDKLSGAVDVSYASKPKLDENKRAVKDKDGVVVRVLDRTSPQVIEVTDATNPKVGKFFTMANFVRLNVELTLAGEGNYAAFITSNKRGDDGEEDNEDLTDDPIKVDGPKAFENVTAKTLHYLNAVKGDDKMLRSLIAYYTKDAPDDRLLTLAYLDDAMSIVLQHKDVKARIEKLTQGTAETKAAA